MVSSRIGLKNHRHGVFLIHYTTVAVNVLQVVRVICKAEDAILHFVINGAVRLALVYFTSRF